MSHDNDPLTGRVVQQEVREWTAPDGTRWRTRRVLIDIGRPDPIAPADPDVMLVPEPHLLRRKPPNVVALNAARAKRQAAMMLRVTTCLRQCGPMTVREMMADLDIPRGTLLAHLRDHEGRVYQRAGKTGGAVVWGLAEDA